MRASHVVIENFRPGVLDRLGLAWDALRAANPKLVLVSLNGFGADSSLRERRAYAPIVHAVTGILHDQGAYAGQPVAQINAAHADTTTALHAVVALLAAFRTTEQTGRGQHVEVPMYDAVLSTYSEAGNALLDPPDDRAMNPIYDAGPLGAVATAGAEQHVWRLLAAHAAIEDPTPPGADVPTKARMRREALEIWMSEQPSRKALLEALAAAGIAAAPVATLSDALTNELARERDLLHFVDDRRGGTRPVVRAPARLSEGSNDVRGPAPRRGEHNVEVLANVLGYEPEHIEALARDGVLSQAALDEP